MRGMGGIVVTAVSPLSAIVLVMLSLRDSEDAHTLWVPYTKEAVTLLILIAPFVGHATGTMTLPPP